MKMVSACNIVESTLKGFEQRELVYQELAKRFGPLFVEKSKVRDSLIGEGVKKPNVDPNRLAAGVSLLIDQDLTPWADNMKTALHGILPSLREVLQIEKGVMDSLEQCMENSESLSALALALLENDWKYYETVAKTIKGESFAILLFAAEAIFSPVFSAIAESVNEPLASLTWEHGYCPVCGSTPSISYLSSKEFTDLDQLVGGGGKKYLHCSLCGHDWRFKRDACVACGNDDSETREVLYVDDRRYERIEACHKCHRYCLNVDLREYEPTPHMDVIQLGLIHLDIYAKKRDLFPLSRTLWNNID